MFDIKVLRDYLKINITPNVKIGREFVAKERTILWIDDVPSIPTSLGISKPLSYFYKSIKLVIIGTTNYNQSLNFANGIYHTFVVRSQIPQLGLVQIIPEMPVFIERVKNLYKFVMMLDVISLWDHPAIIKDGLQNELEGT